MKSSCTCINVEAYQNMKVMGCVFKAVLPVISPSMDKDAHMSLTLCFANPMDAIRALNVSGEQQICIKAATEYCGVEEADVCLCAEKHVLVATPKCLRPNPIAPMELGGAVCEYDVSYYAAYSDGEKLWEIHPKNKICEIGGVDYLKEEREAHVKSQVSLLPGEKLAFQSERT